MDALDLAIALFGVGSTLVGALGWLFKLEGNLRLERELRQSLERRIDGFEARIWDKLETIEQLLHKKADRE